MSDEVKKDEAQETPGLQMRMMSGKELITASEVIMAAIDITGMSDVQAYAGSLFVCVSLVALRHGKQIEPEAFERIMEITSKAIQAEMEKAPAIDPEKLKAIEAARPPLPKEKVH